MASRGGVQVAGSDGTDFLHRQQIANHYQVSAVYKSRLKFSFMMHFLIFIPVCAKFLVNIADSFNLSPDGLKSMDIPEPLLWEWIWTASTSLVFMGLIGTQNNNSNLMKLYAWGTFLFNLCPLVAASLHYLEDLLTYLNRDDKPLQTWRGYPVAFIWFIFIAVAFQIHLLSLYFAVKLIEAWSTKTRRKKE